MTHGSRLGMDQGELVPVERLARDARRARSRSAPDAEAPIVDVLGLERELRAHVGGEVRFDAASRALYGQDASNYRRIPLGVVIPPSKDDVIATVAACRRFGAPVVSRGGGTALAGQTVNEAVVIDFSKRQDRILSIDPFAKRAHELRLGVP